MMKSLGVGIVGTGWVSGEHIKAYEVNHHTEVRGIVSREKARAEAKAREHQLSRCHAYDRLEEMLADPDIHIVSLCTPHHLHVPQDRKSTRLNSSHSQISYAVFCLKKKKNK